MKGFSRGKSGGETVPPVLIVTPVPQTKGGASGPDSGMGGGGGGSGSQRPRMGVAVPQTRRDGDTSDQASDASSPSPDSKPDPSSGIDPASAPAPPHVTLPLVTVTPPPQKKKGGKHRRKRDGEIGPERERERPGDRASERETKFDRYSCSNMEERTGYRYSPADGYPVPPRPRSGGLQTPGRAPYLRSVSAPEGDSERDNTGAGSRLGRVTRPLAWMSKRALSILGGGGGGDLPPSTRRIGQFARNYNFSFHICFALLERMALEPGTMDWQTWKKLFVLRDTVLNKYWNREVKFVIIAMSSRNLDLRSKDENEPTVQNVSFYSLLLQCIYVLPLWNNSTFYVQSLWFCLGSLSV
uniref:Uncharacterized protein n=1 Tax=Eptatretus burgeri TaxID=7764 RepID=A0A8C4QYR7_EPTBU